MKVQSVHGNGFFMGGTVLFGLKDLVLMQFVLPSFASTQG